MVVVVGGSSLGQAEKEFVKAIANMGGLQKYFLKGPKRIFSGEPKIFRWGTKNFGLGRLFFFGGDKRNMFSKN